VKGVKTEYTYTGRVGIDNFGAFTRVRYGPDSEFIPPVEVRNDDQVEILRSDINGWYEIRIRKSRDAALVGLTGWLEDWLVDDKNVPSPPTPIPTQFGLGRHFIAHVERSYSNTDMTDQRLSCVQGLVLDKDQNGVPAAVLYANNGASNTKAVQTNSVGEYEICGLGSSRWSIVLTFVPGNPRLARQAVGFVEVNGDSDQIAILNFIEQ
jgi:hypothetical protein